MSLDYRLQIERKPLKFVAKQDKPTRKRIMDSLVALTKIPPEGDIKSLKGYSGLYRLRVGDFRVIYEVDHKERVVYVVAIGNRGDVYKD